jgi:hypothetical protein
MMRIEMIFTLTLILNISSIKIITHLSTKHSPFIIKLLKSISIIIKKKNFPSRLSNSNRDCNSKTMRMIKF